MGVELASHVSQIRDMLPDVGEGFVAACLEVFDMDVERVLHNILEGTLPPPLHALDRAMPYEDASPAAAAAATATKMEPSSSSASSSAGAKDKGKGKAPAVAAAASSSSSSGGSRPGKAPMGSVGSGSGGAGGSGSGNAYAGRAAPSSVGVGGTGGRFMQVRDLTEFRRHDDSSVESFRTG